MMDLNTFIQKIEQDLVLKQYDFEEFLTLFYNLSNKDKILCQPILSFIIGRSIDIDISSQKFEFSVKERVLVCRLIPLYFALHTDSPAWSSYALTKAIESANKINGIRLSEIVIAFLEILSQFSTPLNRWVYNFCIDISREFTVYYKQRLNELESLTTLKDSCYESCASAAFLRYTFAPREYEDPLFILNTMKALIQNEYFKEFCEVNMYLFENEVYKQKFLQCLFDANLSLEKENLILSVVNSV